jgi:ornithine--oxo-acid transaminase
MITKDTIQRERQFSPDYYKPLPIVLTKGKGIHVWDDNGKQYIDCMSAYSALSHGHCHPKLVAVMKEQVEKLTLTSRAFYTPTLGKFLQRACELIGYTSACPLNTGAEAVEIAIKAVRKWAYTVKGVPDNQAEIIVCTNNFHGRTTTIISFSTEPQYYQHFGPLTPGFKIIPYGDAKALAQAINKNTAAFLVEPIQGEAGIIVPPAGYLAECSKICRENNVLLICDEIQTGLGRTGKLLACHHENIQPDGVLLGKALGGGMLPVSLFLANNSVLDVFKPGDHGSTFGGNELSATMALAALNIIVEEKFSERAAEMGDRLMRHLRQLKSPLISDVRGKGLLIGIEINPKLGAARDVCLALMENGLLSKETHDTVVRLAPPLIISADEIDKIAAILQNTLASL